jgi:ferric-dicitrate binding protein FerR (iron transport regulator)
MNAERKGPTVLGPEPIDWEAAHWVLRLEEADPDPLEPCPDRDARHEAVLHWLTASPAHVRAFLESCETSRRVGRAAAAVRVCRPRAPPTR